MILNRQRTVRVARPPLEAFLTRVREQLRLNGAEITIALVSDPAIARLNETYRHKKGPTDVLSFPSDDRGAASKQDHVGAQHCCAPGPQDRSVKTSSLRATFAPSNRSRRGRPVRTSAAPKSAIRQATPSDARRQGTASAVPNSAIEKGASAASRQGTASAVPHRATRKGASAPEGNFLGDIAISPATARRYAKKHGRTLPNELQILILHGVLHLLGYDHETDNGQMTRVENRLRRRLGLQ
jgi:rRNA maturation RNase YbeY